MSDLLYQGVAGNGYSVLHHQLDEKGVLEGLISVGVTGIIRDKDTGEVVAVETILGRSPAELPIMGPDGEVTLGKMLFPSADEYGEWFRRNTH